MFPNFITTVVQTVWEGKGGACPLSEEEKRRGGAYGGKYLRLLLGWKALDIRTAGIMLITIIKYDN